MDATCAPGDITFPQDLGILNEARKKTEKIIDTLYKSIQTQRIKKPRTSRKKARKAYLKVAKKRRPSREEIRGAIGQQLKYINRNLNHIENLNLLGAKLSVLNPQKYKILLVVTEVC